MPPRRSLRGRQISSKRGRPPLNDSCRKRKRNGHAEVAVSHSAESVGTQKKKAKPPVISLDVTFSSSSELESDIEEEIISPFQLILSSDATGTSVNNLKSPSEKSDSSDSSDCEISGFSPFKNTNMAENSEKVDASDIQDCGDLYGSNYKEERLQAFKILKDCLNTTNPKTNCSLIESSTDDLLNDQDNIAISDSTLKDISASLDISSIPLKRLAKPRHSKRGKAALQSLKSFSHRYHQDIKSTSSDHELSTDDIVFVDDEESSEINIKIRWGMSYIRIPIRKDKKFLVLYQQLAEKYSVSVKDVVLSCKDQVLSPELRLMDSGLSVADIIEGGLINRRKESSMESPSEGKDLISLKIQSSSKNDSTTLTMSKYDKMLILMQNYATSKKLNLDSLKFQFDGETINPNDIAFELDLEGGECIDVFHI